MGGFSLPFKARDTQAAPLKPEEMERIRRVFDQDRAGKKLCAIKSPREDAQMFRSPEKMAVPCECIVELYELLWRWGHRDNEHEGFAANFGFAIPDTIVISKGKPYAWYFISKKDGRLLRKSDGNLTVDAIERRLCSEDDEDQKFSLPRAAWMPVASQFPEARCHSPNAEFLSADGCRIFLRSLRHTHSGILQAFVEPHGVSNFLVRTVEFRRHISICVRTNRSLMLSGRGSLFDRSATFEGWEGLSSSSSRYRNYRCPQMEDLIFAAGETLNRRIEQERVRQMLFLDTHQHVALHFKVTKDHRLYFIFASILSEKEVILQTRPQLLMGDPCMTEELPGLALLPGGSDRRIAGDPFEARKLKEAEDAEVEGSDGRGRSPRRESSLPPITPRPTGASQSRPRRRPLSEQRTQIDQGLMPRMATTRPEVPGVPYKVVPLIHALEEVGRFEYPPPYVGTDDIVKRPLIIPNSSRSLPASSPRPDSEQTVDAPLTERVKRRSGDSLPEEKPPSAAGEPGSEVQPVGSLPSPW